ncbi:uncharacterized protein [Primulina eburnea]|uniref:uncharacterized protein n=1 Tax=Primulina eburnea TaxID=1245227 RepID=UPI003C6C1802
MRLPTVCNVTSIVSILFSSTTPHKMTKVLARLVLLQLRVVVHIFSVYCLAMHCSKKSGWERGSRVLETSILLFSLISLSMKGMNSSRSKWWCKMLTLFRILDRPPDYIGIHNTK